MLEMLSVLDPGQTRLVGDDGAVAWGATGSSPRAGTEGTAAPPEEYEASKPLASTEPSAANSTIILPDVDVTEPGMLLPLNNPSRVPLLLEPS